VGHQARKPLLAAAHALLAKRDSIIEQIPEPDRERVLAQLELAALVLVLGQPPVNLDLDPMDSLRVGAKALVEPLGVG
jgi:hypothetical protein